MASDSKEAAEARLPGLTKEPKPDNDGKNSPVAEHSSIHMFVRDIMKIKLQHHPNITDKCAGLEKMQEP